jgi:hypothetical protein
MLALLMLVTRTQIVLKPEYALGVSLAVALLVAWFVDTRVPLDEEDEEEDDLVEKTEDAREEVDSSR